MSNNPNQNPNQNPQKSNIPGQGQQYDQSKKQGRQDNNLSDKDRDMKSGNY